MVLSKAADPGAVDVAGNGDGSRASSEIDPFARTDSGNEWFFDFSVGDTPYD